MGTITVAGRLVHDHHAFGTLTMAEAFGKVEQCSAISLAFGG